MLQLMLPDGDTNRTSVDEAAAGPLSISAIIAP
jgi:hypothetical protein